MHTPQQKPTMRLDQPQTIFSVRILAPPHTYPNGSNDSETAPEHLSSLQRNYGYASDLSKHSGTISEQLSGRRFRCGEVLALLGVSLAASILFVLVADEVLENETLGFDRSVLLAIHSISHPVLDHLAVNLTQFGDVSFVPVLTLVLAVLLGKKLGTNYALLLLVGVGGSSLLNIVLKLLFSRQRPELWQWIVHESTFSFPSGHAMASMSLAASLVAALWFTRYRLLALCSGAVYVVVIALTRLYLGVHYPTDIFAGWLLAVAWVGVVSLAVYAPHKPWLPKKRSKPSRQKDTRPLPK